MAQGFNFTFVYNGERKAHQNIELPDCDTSEDCRKMLNDLYLNTKRFIIMDKTMHNLDNVLFIEIEPVN